MKILKNIIFYGFLLALIIFAVTILRQPNTNYKWVGNYAFCNVLTPSMHPTIEKGSLVVIEKINPINLESGDIITYQGKSTDALVTHRIIKKSITPTLTFITKGDANETQDIYPVESSQVIGKVIYFIPIIGKILFALHENIFLTLSIVIGIVALISIVRLVKNLYKN